MFKWLQNLHFRRVVAIILILILGVLAILTIPSILFVIWEEMHVEPLYVITVEKLHSILDLVIWVLIIVELIDSIRVYLEEKSLHLETIISISIVAMGRKIIAVRLRDYDSIMVLGMAGLLIALGVTYYLVRRAHAITGPDSWESQGEKPAEKERH